MCRSAGRLGLPNALTFAKPLVGRHVQYRVEMQTHSAGVSPEFYEVTIAGSLQ